jgi:hypothetical protein
MERKSHDRNPLLGKVEALTPPFVKGGGEGFERIFR